MAKIKIRKEKLLEAIATAHGLKTGICEMLGISRPTLDRYLLDPKIAEAFEFAKERDIDRAEYKLMEAVERGESWAVTLKLKDSKRGKERGYGNSLDVTTGGEKITKIVVEWQDDGNDSEDQTPPTA